MRGGFPKCIESVFGPTVDYSCTSRYGIIGALADPFAVIKLSERLLDYLEY